MQPPTAIPFSPPLTYEQWFLSPFIRALTVSASLGWHNVTILNADMNPNHDFAPGPEITDDVFILALDGVVHTELYTDGRLSKQVSTVGSFQIYPRGLNQSHGRWDSAVKALFVRLPHQHIVDTAETILKGDPEAVELPLILHSHDQFLSASGFALHHCLQRGLQNGDKNGLSELYAESLMGALVSHLLYNYSNHVVRPVNLRGKMTPAQQRTVREYIEANLHQKISLDDLAKCIHVGVPHFERLFRATFNCAPYHYVLQCRIERAKMLLCYAHKSLYEVARYCGFANQSHFTRHFTKFVGMSPTRFSNTCGKE
ncbi:MAG: AraC family transcriptional regulator [Anaerolineae bacterium]|nr:AraC family transcriptional regulator [Anaerolineae bacterium]